MAEKPVPGGGKWQTPTALSNVTGAAAPLGKENVVSPLYYLLLLPGGGSLEIYPPARKLFLPVWGNLGDFQVSQLM